MRDKFEAFKAALIDLCKVHQVQLCVSGYDALQVWDLDPADYPIHSNGFEDKTKERV